MNRLSIKAKIITGLITGGMLLSSAGFAFASTTSSSTTSSAITTGKTISVKGVDKGAKLESELKLAVSSNIITQDESDKILAYETSKVPTGEKPAKPEKGVKPTKPDLFKELVDANILTQAKADALKASQESQRDIQRQADLETRINGFVTNNTITQDQATKIIAALNADEVTKKATREQTSTMTETERKTYMDSLRGTEVDPLKALVTAGTITQSQADKLVSVSHKGPGPVGHKGGPKQADASLTTEAEALVK